MATKKKAGKKAQISFAVKAAINFIPLCIQIEHSGGNPNPLKLSISGNRCPNAVYWMLQNNIPSASHIDLPLGYFKGHLGSGTFHLALDANGMTDILILDASAKPTPPGHPIRWDHNPGLHMLSGGGIIVDA